jgi:hypothetical protein
MTIRVVLVIHRSARFHQVSRPLLKGQAIFDPLADIGELRVSSTGRGLPQTG